MNLMTNMTIVEEAVVLAAGLGSRMSSNPHGGPKPLVPVLGRPLLEYALRNLDEIGIRKTVVVTGSSRKKIRQWLAETEFDMEVDETFNPRFLLGNGVSALCGLRSTTTDSVVVMMGDHLVSPELVTRAAGKEHVAADLGLVVDVSPHMKPQLDEPTRVLVNDLGQISGIGKDIDTWNCVDTGVFLVSRKLEAVIEIVARRTGDCTMSNAVSYMIDSDMDVRAWDSNGAFWLDIDTPYDVEFAEKTILRNPELKIMFDITLEESTQSVPGKRDHETCSADTERNA